MKNDKSTIATLTVLGAGLLLPMLAARASREVVGAGYRLVTDQDPPRNPAASDVDWKDAVMWTVVTGVIGGLSRLAVRRALAATDIPAEGYDFEYEAERLT